MVNTISMQDMRHLNLFEKITRISTRFCFNYNETIFFCVPKPLVMTAVGREGKNIKTISEIIGKKIKVIPIPQGIHHAKDFIRTIVAPVEFKGIEISNNEIVLNAGARSKAALLGRNKRRLDEMKKIVKEYFGKELKIA